MSCASNSCNLKLIPKRASQEEPCQTCCVVVNSNKFKFCKNPHKPKKGEPACGCVYGCPCKAACYDWDPCIKPLNY